MAKAIKESRALAVREADGAKSGRLRIGLINPGWGSSGFYSQEVLERAAEAKVFPAGTQMFLDHPTETEKLDRPERSVRDLAAVLTEDAVWDGQRLVGEAQVFGAYVDLLTDEKFAKSIGVSIRALAEMSVGEAEGRKGLIIDELVESQSVDFVTKAGRGGQILEVLESARAPEIAERAVARGVSEATSNDTLESLQDVLKEQYGGEKAWVWVRDFDQSTVWFQLDTPDSSETFQEGYTLADDGTATLAGDRIEVKARTRYEPINQPQPATESGTTSVPAPAGQPHPIPSSEENTMGHIQVDEAEHARVTEAAGRVPTLEAERDSATQRATTAERELALFKAREAARPQVAAKVGESALPATRKAKIVEAVLRQVALDDKGQPNAEELVRLTESEVKDAETEIAEIAEALGHGSVRGFGATVPAGGTTVSEADAAAAIAAAFGRSTKVEEA